MTNWRPWNIGMWSLWTGLILFFVGFFSIYLDEPIFPKLVSRALMVLGFALVSVSHFSGFNRFVWSIRAKFSPEERKQLSRLRGYGVLIVSWTLVGVALPPALVIFGNPLPEVRHDSVVMFSFIVSMIGFLGGGLVRFAEFRLLKSSSMRTDTL